MADEWISITDAARRLTASGDAVDRSTLSRYVSQHAEALQTKREGKSNLVDFAALAMHRADNVRLQSQAKRIEQEPITATASGSYTLARGNAAARDKEAVAQMRELDLAERLDRVTIVTEVADAGQTALVMMRNAFERAVESEAAALSLKYGWDERMVRLALKAFANTGVEVFHRELLVRLDGRRRARDAGEEFEQETASLQ